ncbi:MAG: AraC family transcriptional regulator ligand-binding domain-containing protein [Rubrivivax sp.]
MTLLVRSASLTHFAQVAADCGLDARALVVEVGLPPRCLSDPDLKVPSAAVGELLERAAQRAREPAFALRMVEQRRLSNLGPLALLVRDQPTLRSALEALVQHIHLHNEALAVRVSQEGGHVVIREELLGEGAARLHQAAELVLGVTWRVLAIFMGAQWRARRVCFVHPAPASRMVHRRVFGDRLAFGQEFNGIVCDASDLDAPNPAADPVMARYAQRLLASDARRVQRASDRVRLLVVMLLPHGHCRVEVVAQHLGVDRRTVARHLAAEGTSFGSLVDGVRTELLARYRQGTRPLAEVAALLGFSAPSAFSRWHRQRFGTSARALAR